MQKESAGRQTEVDQKGRKLPAAGDGFGQKRSQTTGQIAGETDVLVKGAEALDQGAAQAKADMGVVIADLPRVETLARSVGETIRTLGSEARTQAGDLEVGLRRLAQESSAAQEASAIDRKRVV